MQPKSRLRALKCDYTLCWTLIWRWVRKDKIEMWTLQTRYNEIYPPCDYVTLTRFKMHLHVALNFNLIMSENVNITTQMRWTLPALCYVMFFLMCWFIFIYFVSYVKVIIRAGGWITSPIQAPTPTVKTRPTNIEEMWKAKRKG